RSTARAVAPMRTRARSAVTTSIWPDCPPERRGLCILVTTIGRAWADPHRHGALYRAIRLTGISEEPVDKWDEDGRLIRDLHLDEPIVGRACAPVAGRGGGPRGVLLGRQVDGEIRGVDKAEGLGRRVEGGGAGLARVAGAGAV